MGKQTKQNKNITQYVLDTNIHKTQDELTKKTHKKKHKKHTKKKKRTPIKKHKRKKTQQKTPQHTIDSNHIKVQEFIDSL